MVLNFDCEVTGDIHGNVMFHLPYFDCEVTGDIPGNVMFHLPYFGPDDY